MKLDRSQLGLLQHRRVKSMPFDRKDFSMVKKLPLQSAEGSSVCSLAGFVVQHLHSTITCVCIVRFLHSVTSRNSLGRLLKRFLHILSPIPRLLFEWDGQAFCSTPDTSSIPRCCLQAYQPEAVERLSNQQSAVIEDIYGEKTLISFRIGRKS